MDKIQYKDPLTGRLYDAMQDGQQIVILGPPEGLVDLMGWPEPFATNLHNALYNRHIFTFREAQTPKGIQGALQEALQLDVQKLTEIFLNYETEVVT